MLSGISVWSLLLILGIVVLLFGSKKLRSLGSDLGEAVRGFRRSVKDDGAKPDTKPSAEQPPGQERADSANDKPEAPNSPGS